MDDVGAKLMAQKSLWQTVGSESSAVADGGLEARIPRALRVWGPVSAAHEA